MPLFFLTEKKAENSKLEKSGIKLHSLLKISEIAKTLYEIGAIDEESLKTILKQVKKELILDLFVEY